MFRRGAWTMLLASLLFSIMSAMVRGLPQVPSYQTVGVRFAVGTVAMLAGFALGIRRMRWNNWPWIVARGISGGLAVMVGFWAIQNIGMSKAVLYGHTYLIFASIFAVPFLGERIDLSHWAAILVAMLGIGLSSGVQHFAVARGDLVAIAGAVASGFAVVCVTKCRNTDSSMNIFWSQCLFGLAIVAWPAARSWVWPTVPQWGMLLAIAAVATFAQLAMTYAYKYTGATYGSLLVLSTPALSTVLGVWLFDERPGLRFFLGAALMLAACCYLSLRPVGRAVEDAGDWENGEVKGGS